MFVHINCFRNYFKKKKKIIHFPKSLPEDFFKQLTAEKAITKFTKGFPKREWVKTSDRNEALDMFVYAIAALNIFAFLVYPKYTINQMLEILSVMVENMSNSHGLAVPQQPVKKRSRVINSGLDINNL